MYSRPGDDSSLLRRYQTAQDLAARDELVRKYLPLIRSLAKRYSYTSEPLDDLCQRILQIANARKRARTVEQCGDGDRFVSFSLDFARVRIIAARDAN